MAWWLAIPETYTLRVHSPDVVPSEVIPPEVIPPTVAIVSPVADPTNISPIPITATFSEDVVGFGIRDITVENGTAGDFIASSDRQFVSDVTPDADGMVTVDIAAGVAQDAAGN